MQSLIDGHKHHFLTEQIDVFRPPRDKGVGCSMFLPFFQGAAFLGGELAFSSFRAAAA